MVICQYEIAVRVTLAIQRRCADTGQMMNTFIQEGQYQMNCTIEQFESVVTKFKIFVESVDIVLASEADALRQELVVICAELLESVREEIKAGEDSII